MGSWRSFASKSEALLKSNNIAKAQKKVSAGLEKHPNQANLLCIAIQAFRASDKRQESLEFAELLITHHPTNWEGYGRSAQDLVALKRFEEAQQHIQAGLKKLPNHPTLLNIANAVFLASGNREKALEYAKLLITHHPGIWDGYEHTAKDLIALKQFEDLERFGEWLKAKPIKEIFLESINDWIFTANLGQRALKDLDESCLPRKLQEFSEGREIFIPIGDCCLGAQFISDSGGRKFALPFDWLFIEPKQIKRIIKDDFQNFINPENLQSQYPRRQCGHTLYGNTNFFNHHDPSREPDRSAFLRRIERFKKLVSTFNSDIVYFNVRLEERHRDLVDLLDVLPSRSKILSFVFLGNGSHEKPTINDLGQDLLQIVFQCDNKNTKFAKKDLHPSGYTDGSFIHCPYSSAYAGSILNHILSHSQRHHR